MTESALRGFTGYGGQGAISPQYAEESANPPLQEAPMRRVHDTRRLQPPRPPESSLPVSPAWGFPGSGPCPGRTEAMPARRAGQAYRGIPSPFPLSTVGPEPSDGYPTPLRRKMDADVHAVRVRIRLRSHFHRPYGATEAVSDRRDATEGAPTAAAGLRPRRTHRPATPLRRSRRFPHPSRRRRRCRRRAPRLPRSHLPICLR